MDLSRARKCQQCRTLGACRLFDYGEGVSEWLCVGRDSCFEWAASGTRGDDPSYSNSWGERGPYA